MRACRLRETRTSCQGALGNKEPNVGNVRTAGKLLHEASAKQQSLLIIKQCCFICKLHEAEGVYRSQLGRVA